jgi:hypothetical protein
MRDHIHRQNRSRPGEGWKSVDGRDRREDTGAIGGIEALEDSPAVAIPFYTFLTLVAGANGISRANKNDDLVRKIESRRVPGNPTGLIFWWSFLHNG